MGWAYRLLLTPLKPSPPPLVAESDLVLFQVGVLWSQGRWAQVWSTLKACDPVLTKKIYQELCWRASQKTFPSWSQENSWWQAQRSKALSFLPPNAQCNDVGCGSHLKAPKGRPRTCRESFQPRVGTALTSRHRRPLTFWSGGNENNLLLCKSLLPIRVTGSKL